MSRCAEMLNQRLANIGQPIAQLVSTLHQRNAVFPSPGAGRTSRAAEGPLTDDPRPNECELVVVTSDVYRRDGNTQLLFRRGSG